jgi:hypothetical protein
VFGVFGRAEVQLGREVAELRVGKDFPSRIIMHGTSVKRMSRLLEKNIQIG